MHSTTYHIHTDTILTYPARSQLLVCGRQVESLGCQRGTKPSPLRDIDRQIWRVRDVRSLHSVAGGREEVGRVTTPHSMPLFRILSSGDLDIPPNSLYYCMQAYYYYFTAMYILSSRILFRLSSILLFFFFFVWYNSFSLSEGGILFFYHSRTVGSG